MTRKRGRNVAERHGYRAESEELEGGGRRGEESREEKIKVHGRRRNYRRKAKFRRKRKRSVSEK